jgi:uncharacterized protein (UPF0303 family)
VAAGQRDARQTARGTRGWNHRDRSGRAGLFACTTIGATPGQADWVRRKRNTVRRFARSSYGVGRLLEKNGETMEARHALELKDYAAHGGGFPVWVNGVGCIGSVVVSGLPQRDDHQLVVSAIAELLGVDAPKLA